MVSVVIGQTSGVLTGNPDPTGDTVESWNKWAEMLQMLELAPDWKRQENASGMIGDIRSVRCAY